MDDLDDNARKAVSSIGWHFIDGERVMRARAVDMETFTIEFITAYA